MKPHVGLTSSSTALTYNITQLIFCSRTVWRGHGDLQEKSNACSQIRLEVHAARASVPHGRTAGRTPAISRFVGSECTISIPVAKLQRVRQRRVPQAQQVSRSCAQTLGAGRQHRGACTGRDHQRVTFARPSRHTHQHHRSPHRHAILTLTMPCGTC